MKNVMGIIYTGESDSRLRELTLTRAIAALPLAGRYRVIDFLVSSMVNSGIRNVGVVMQKNYHSLMDHLGSGKEWDLHGKNNGLVILPPFLTRENVGVYNGVLEALRSNASYLGRSKQEYVILTNSTIVYNTRFDDMVRFHVESDSDITIMYTKDPSMRRDEYGTYIAVDDDGTITDIEVEPTRPNYPNTSMDVFIMKRELMRTLVDKGVAHGHHNFTKDILQKMLQDTRMRVTGFEFKGSAWRIDSIQGYFKCSMDFLDSDVRKEVFNPAYPVYTKVRDEMPAHYGENATLVNTLVADGCMVDGTVENSILFRGVRIAPDAHVKNCVIMQDGQVHSGAYIENCILDKQAVIKRNARLIGPTAYPIVIGKNVVI